MATLAIGQLDDTLSFGARVAGVDRQSLQDQAVRDQLKNTFEERGVIVFEDMEPSPETHLALSAVFGPLDHHGLTEDKSGEPQVVNLKQQQDVVDVNGERLSAYLPWHFDACYTEKLNRAALLRAVEMPPEGGMTGFADGVQLYADISPRLRAKFEDLKVLYHPRLMFMHQRFGVPQPHRWVSISDSAASMIKQCETARRSVHPAIWQRKSGERVLHVSPWQADGILGHAGPAGDALLEELCQEIYAKMRPYWHKWALTDMVLWDNWRFIHAVSGNDPKYVRHMQRATIEGDYGLGAFETAVDGGKPAAVH